jgi:hypothetical protein
LEWGLKTSRELDYRQGEAEALVGLGLVYAEHDPQTAVAHWRQASEIFEQIGVPATQIDWRRLYKKTTPSDRRDESL